MTDYGHELLFGSFITPVNKPGQPGRRPGHPRRSGRP